ncbi:YhgE/Pip domain-containing protein [Paenibacillus sp.]|uniref:YhgE/Pip domain-containing protein n=1 Tax=Paenibacillus sp. TaxID=58172 RepID=UPI002D2397C5|nr:ABC transporter permease [Paenibacillus sp.]HZG86508.1 ABC transporter permease [Paenibacillus sp.]
MSGVWRAFFKLPMTTVGIATAALFQLIFCVVWMTGYDGVNENADRLTVAIVNEDGEAGSVAAGALGGQLPFRIEHVPTLEDAQKRLDERQVQMVVHIPSGFGAALAAPDAKAALNYYINESNPATIKSMMTAASSQITSAVNDMAAARGVETALARLQLPEAQASALAKGLVSRVEGNVVATNPVNNMASQMVPMMMVLASYVGSMLLSMNLEQTSMALSSRFTRWQRFGVRQLINAGTAVVVGLFAVSLVTLFGGAYAGGFLALWGFVSLVLFSFMTLSQIFLLLFGPGGMVFNIVLLSAQLVSSGAMVPRELLPDFYRELGAFLPATYAVEGLMDLLFGGPSAAGAAASLAAAIAICLAVGAGAAAVRRAAKQPAQRSVAAA